MSVRLACLLAFGLGSPFAAVAADPPPAAFTFDARWRLETVDDDSFVREAGASTLRLRAGYRSAVHDGFSFVVEGEFTRDVFGGHFNSTANGETTYPTVVDPDSEELNQAYLRYAPREGSQFTLGRQRIVHDNQRFFGNVGWRQNEQTFDAFDAQHRTSNGWALRYSYLDRVQRIYGEDHPNPLLGRWQLDAHLLSAAHALGPGTLTGYAHLIENQSLPASSHRNLGLRYVARRDVPQGLGWNLALEWAVQDDYADGSAAIDADYLLLEGGLAWRGNGFRAGWERMGGDGSYGFATPFATLHAFDGWADRFLNTPASGLEDAYLGWSRKQGAWNASVVFHDFRSEVGSIHYGREWDASLAWSFAPRWTAMFKLAAYDAGDIGADVTKTWLSLEYAY
jgi:hypothetical protein